MMRATPFEACSRVGVLLLWLLVASWHNVVAANIVGGCCALAYDASHDYFPNKSRVDFATGFTVEYHSHYKVVDIPEKAERYVLYQRGTPQPSVQDIYGGQTGLQYIQIPIERAAVLSNSYFAYFELLGERRSMVVTTRHEYLNDPCLQKMRVEDGILDGVTDRDLVNNDVFATRDVDVIFRWSGSRDDGFTGRPVVRVDRDSETTAAGIMEWTEYVALFFNREREASHLVTEMKSRYDCIVSYVRQQPAVRVLYSSFSYSSASSQVRCSFSISTWHQRMLNDVGGTVIGAYPGHQSSGPCNMTAFREHAETADVWLYKSNNFQEGRYGSKWAVMWNISSEVADVAPFRNQRTFDINGNHFRDFWASRMVELDVELEDLVVVLHPSLNYPHQRVWWLNVATEVDPGLPPISQCTCKYGPQQLKADACPGNPSTAPVTNPNAQSDYGCNGELTASLCTTQPMAVPVCGQTIVTSTTSAPGSDTSHSHKPEPKLALVVISSLLVALLGKCD